MPVCGGRKVCSVGGVRSFRGNPVRGVGVAPAGIAVQPRECSVCRKRPEVTWYPEQKEYVVRCDGGHALVTRPTRDGAIKAWDSRV